MDEIPRKRKPKRMHFKTGKRKGVPKHECCPCCQQDLKAKTSPYWIEQYELQCEQDNTILLEEGKRLGYEQRKNEEAKQALVRKKTTLTDKSTRGYWPSASSLKVKHTSGAAKKLGLTERKVATP